MNLSTDEINKNISSMAAAMKSSGAQCLYVPSFDQYISEYVPLWNNLRYYVTGFTGSTADVLIIEDEAHLFVDSRYHLQADEEINSDKVVVHKAKGRIFRELLDLAKQKGISEFGVIPERTPIGHCNEVGQKFKNFKLVNVNEKMCAEKINFQLKESFPEVFEIDAKTLGQSVEQRLKRCNLKDGEALFLSAIDDVAWLTNLRGYHLSFLSSFLSKAIVVKDAIHLLTPKNIKFSNYNSLINIHHYNDNISEILPGIISENSIKKITYDKSFSTLNDKDVLKKSSVDLVEGSGLTFIKNIKLDVEIPEYERIFNLGDQAIFDTIHWCKSKVQQGEKVSELDLYHQTTKSYQKYGSGEQSFNTISGAGENGAIVHYGDPKSDRIISKDDLVLLDSGGYFESGLATDTTRTFLADSSSTKHALFEEYKKAYTLVVRAQIQAESAIFKAGSKGREIAMLSRQVLYKQGLDFGHGIGHGVGVHVHEPGVRISQASDLPLNVGMIVSIEPGLYFAGRFGIRHENIVVVEKHPKFDGFLRFRSLVFIGLEEGLLDLSTFSPEEKHYYETYKQECLKRSRVFS